MLEIKTMNKIAAVGLNRLDPAVFSVDTGADPAGILVRSAALHDMEFPASLLGIARAGAGVNNIPLDRCTEAGICVFNTPGANANAVKELAVAALLLASRDIAGGIEWCRGLTGDDVDKQVEKGKNQFVGPEIMGKTLGVIGLGAIGGLVANVAVNLGMTVLGCDPYLSVMNALHLSRAVTVTDQQTLLSQCD
ncbi:MAG: 3-phosphoglycerate dehydrogenase, partial [Oscillospiraceae bacterium]|nr:3-phosphoglycerate dehydrogenase [Oscillospiraceae bacterium]